MRGVRLPKYLPWTDDDMAAVERALKRYKMAGLEASFDIGKFAEGIVSVSQVDPRVRDAPIAIFEIHKLARKDVTNRTHWVVQTQSIDGQSQALTPQGSVSASSVVIALAKAEKDLQDGLPNKDTFDMAANAYWLK